MTPAEFEALVAPLAELEDYLRDQAHERLVVGRVGDARGFEKALRLAIAAHAQAQLLLDGG